MENQNLASEMLRLFELDFTLYPFLQQHNHDYSAKIRFVKKSINPFQKFKADVSLSTNVIIVQNKITVETIFPVIDVFLRTYNGSSISGKGGLNLILKVNIGNAKTYQEMFQILETAIENEIATGDPIISLMSEEEKKSVEHYMLSNQ